MEDLCKMLKFEYDMFKTVNKARTDPKNFVKTILVKYKQNNPYYNSLVVEMNSMKKLK